MSAYRCFELNSVAIGAVNSDGTFGSNLTTIVNIVPGSAVFAIGNPGDNKFYVEDDDYADIVAPNNPEPMIEFATRDMDPSYAALAFGGTGAGTVFTAPQTAQGLREYSVQAISKAYNGNQLKLQITRTSLHGTANLTFSKSEPGQLGFSAAIMNPATATFPWKYSLI